MRKITKSIRPLLSAAVLAGMSLGTIAAANAGSTISTVPTNTKVSTISTVPTNTKVGHWVKLPCAQVGSPLLPTIYFSNNTLTALPAGRTVAYQTNTGFAGSFKLASAVKPMTKFAGPVSPPFNYCNAWVFQ